MLFTGLESRKVHTSYKTNGNRNGRIQTKAKPDQIPCSHSGSCCRNTINLKPYYNNWQWVCLWIIRQSWRRENTCGRQFYDQHIVHALMKCQRNCIWKGRIACLLSQDVHLLLDDFEFEYQSYWRQKLNSRTVETHGNYPYKEPIKIL